MKSRYLIALPMAGALILGPALATPAFADSQSGGSSKGTRTERGHHGARPFVAVGTVTATDTMDGTATITVPTGRHGQRGRTVTLTVTADTKIRLDRATIDLLALPVGAKVAVVGVRAGAGADATITATTLIARSSHAKTEHAKTEHAKTEHAKQGKG